MLLSRARNSIGTIDNKGNEVTFNFRANQPDDSSPLGHFSFCDTTAGVRMTKGKIQSLSITDNTASFSGVGRLDDESRITFNVSVSDNGSLRTSDIISINLSNGYSASGTLIRGDIRIYYPAVAQRTINFACRIKPANREKRSGLPIHALTTSY